MQTSSLRAELPPSIRIVRSFSPSPTEQRRSSARSLTSPPDALHWRDRTEAGAIMHDMIHSASYMAHGYCLLWKPWLVVLHAGSDFLIFAAYFAIPVAIWLFLRQRPDLELKPLAILFAAFIFLCGLTHLVQMVTLWWPIYETQAFVKAATAFVSRRDRHHDLSAHPEGRCHPEPALAAARQRRPAPRDRGARADAHSPARGARRAREARGRAHARAGARQAPASRR